VEKRAVLPRSRQLFWLLPSIVLFFAVVKYLVAGLVTEVLVAVPAQTVIAINELQPPQVPAQAPRHAILP
jgi:hypothetical protein